MENHMTAYQVMPELSAEDFSVLKADIALRGVLVPVEYDEAGNVLDGHHRKRIAAELGIVIPEERGGEDRAPWSYGG